MPYDAGPRDAQLHDLNLAQRDIYFDRTLNPDRLYLVGGQMHVDGPFDEDVARAAYRAAGRDVAAMRARLVVHDHRPMLAVAPPDDADALDIDIEDVSATAEPEMTGAARAEALWAEPIRPEDGGLMHDMRLIRINPLRRIVLFRCHHLIIDGWAGLQLFDRFRRAYDTILAGATPDPDPAPLPDPAPELAWIDSPKAAADAAFWAAELACMQPAAFLRRPPFGPSLKARLSIDRETYGRIEAVAAACGTPMPALLMTLFGLLVHDLTGQEAIVLATPVRNRMTAAERAAITPYVRLMPLGLAIDPKAMLGAAAAGVQAAMRRGFRHQRLPMGAIGKALGRRPGGGEAMLGDVLFSFETRARTPGFDGCATVLHPISHEGDKYALSLHVRDLGGEGLVDFDLAMDAAHWGELGASPALDRLGPMLDALADATPETPLGMLLAPMPGAEARLIARFNDTARPLPGPAADAASIVDLIRATAAAAPQAPALITAAGAVTSLGALDRWSDAIARRLIDTGATAGVQPVIGVMIDRSPAMIAAVIGVMKAGAAFLPLDPALPPARLTELAVDASATAIVTCPAFIDSPAFMNSPGTAPPAPLLVIGDTADDDIALTPPLPDLPAIGGDDLAYVLYTSGTTGRPKGVMIGHAALLNRLVWQWHALGHRVDEPVLHRTTSSFDVSVWEMLMPPAFGAPMVLCPALTAHDPAALAALIARHRVACLHFVPSALNAALAAMTPADDANMAGVRLVITSGEALPPECVRTVAARWRAARIINLYGPTEAAIDVSHHDGDPQDTVVPIGRPVWNTSLHVVDPATGAPVAVGRPGALMIGGVQLARGYLGRPDLTAERFPIAPDGTGRRWYDSGDRALLTPDGVMLYLGRSDDQVKIDGARVEPGEVADRLLSHPAVREAAVRAVRMPGGQRLIGWYATGGVALDAAALRSWIAERLPGWMVPAALIAVDSLPVRANGKLDAARLPMPVEALNAARTALAPATPLEAVITRVFAQVLNAADIDAGSDFFLAGGHSLLALRLLAEVEAATGLHADLKHLFLHPTPAGLATALEHARDSGPATDDPVPLTPRDPDCDRPPLFLLPPVAGEPAVFLDLARLLDHPAIGLRFPAATAAGLPEFARHAAACILACQSDPAADHGAARRRWRLVGYSLGGMVAFEAARLIEAAHPGARVDLVLLDTAVAPVPTHDDAVSLTFEREFSRRALDTCDATGRAAATLNRAAIARLKALVLRNARAVAGWQARGAIRGDITMISARRDPAEHRPDRWAAHTTGRFTRIDVDGGHFDLLADRLLPEIAGIIDEALLAPATLPA
ncbi:amino acid adenylation domain-containing protein [Tistrella sp. BH-R2-4]|uniref:Amino acid adenylation domain-containing protein n=1 Tax=Tistrella arctica TaxID=3133430 RepID=A0ABU9YMG4_9PROT